MNIEKRYACIIIGLLVLAVGIFAVNAYGGSQPSVVGHSAGEIEGAVVSGSIMAFDLSSCPSGWSELTSARGRVIVGLNPGDANFDSKGETGGEKTHTLTVAEMPNHRHRTGGPYGGGDVSRAYGEINQYTEVGQTSDEGGSQPHNNLQPYISYIYCKKN